MADKYFTGKPCKRGHIADRLKSTRACVACNQEDSRQEDKRRKDSERGKAWRAANPDAQRAKEAARNRPPRRQSEADRMRNAAYRQSSYFKEWHEANPEKNRQYGQARRARKMQAPGTHTAEDIKEIRSAQKGKCAICRKKIAGKYHVDHIRPLSKGGSNARSNLQITCGPCNCRKHDRDPIDHMQSLGFLL